MECCLLPVLTYVTAALDTRSLASPPFFPSLTLFTVFFYTLFFFFAPTTYTSDRRNRRVLDFTPRLVLVGGHVRARQVKCVPDPVNPPHWTFPLEFRAASLPRLLKNDGVTLRFGSRPDLLTDQTGPQSAA